MATLTVESCEYDGSYVKAEVKLTIEDIEKTPFWLGKQAEITSNEITIFSPVKNVSFKTRASIVRVNEFYYRIKSFSNNSTTVNIQEGEFDDIDPDDFEVTYKIQECVNEHVDEPKNKLLGDLRNHEQNHFTIRCKENEFTINKAILQARSPVFRSMFEANFKEGQENQVKIPDFEPEIVEKMIEFCETDKIKDTVGYELELYKIARKYLIKSFMNTCERLQLAILYSDEKLLEFLYSWMRPNIQHICKTSGFDALSNEEIVGIFRQPSDEKNE